MGFQIRAILPDEIRPAAKLVARVFEDSVAPLYGPAGVREFMSYASAEALVERLRGIHRAFVAVDESGAVVGMVEVRDLCHVSLLFVETPHQREGIGRGLLAAAVHACKSARPGLETLTVHASPNSVSAYENFGFTAREREQEKNGIRFVPMTLVLGQDVDS